jgi:hypothetical protein
VKALDGERVLGEKPFPVEFDARYDLALEVRGNVVRAFAAGLLLFEHRDTDAPFAGGGVALLVEDGRLECGPVRVSPLA